MRALTNFLLSHTGCAYLCLNDPWSSNDTCTLRGTASILRTSRYNSGSHPGRDEGTAHANGGKVIALETRLYRSANVTGRYDWAYRAWGRPEAYRHTDINVSSDDGGRSARDHLIRSIELVWCTAANKTAYSSFAGHLRWTSYLTLSSPNLGSKLLMERTREPERQAKLNGDGPVGERKEANVESMRCVWGNEDGLGAGGGEGEGEGDEGDGEGIIGK
ncbi:hypothetical protein BDY19DRAFT_1050291 [Irpex rosettiformis]|uniref:Uncharacterized protein n=1 Tax=Irpex rosettiformis TaxID=378272 RepID=A0ACB8TVN6_9APHY|nr:hypothetical protein BDY19DRAFT_1050291 [Irpex rosettiformis]